MAKNPKLKIKENSSFRDPSGVIYYQNNKVFRKVFNSYKENFVFFENSGLSKALVGKKLLLGYKKTNITSNQQKIYLTLSVPKIPHISYPYEWTFPQLKAAALLTLEIQKNALNHSMTLKDASAYNVQFLGFSPIFIDHLSFEKLNQGPWIAYGQFCRHFLGPLLLMGYVDQRLNCLLKNYIDGIPLDLVSKLLPKKTYLNPGIFSHIHLHSKNQKKFANRSTKVKKINLHNQLAIIDNLESIISNLQPKADKTEWGDYYEFTNYSDKSFKHKKTIVSSLLDKTKPKKVLDLGANNGEFSKLASKKNIYTVSLDLDPVAVEKNYIKSVKDKDNFLLALISDLTNPTPSIGWDLKERKSFINRADFDTVFALALIHHICISNNVPFSLFAKFLQRLGKYLIVEFIPKSDSKVQILLSTRTDIFDRYSQDEFENEFSKYFMILDKIPISKSERTIYLMKVKK